ncbi:MAG TPA: DUF1549 and DUF1553 domain-containing protein [Verrucomicrobiota bacterium]|nr:DUF1549 and DUF1553 domain-containing protein [Verrucomicrobiota bacterium]
MVRSGASIAWIASLLWGFDSRPVNATPANKAAFEKHYDRFLTKSLDRCTTCHLPSDRKLPETLEEFPHNPFGDRLRRLGDEMASTGQKKDLVARLTAIAAEDADGDGVSNQVELLLGHSPGDTNDSPSASELAETEVRAAEFSQFLASYRWRPFESVSRPVVPTPSPASFVVRNPVDAFLAAEWDTLGLKARPEASKEVLLRRVYVDLIGLNPTPAELEAFLADSAPDAYEEVVERLLADPRHGERWARHWMDVWRYSDWAGWADGNQIRDSKPHIWRWRDWIIESLNADKPYDQVVKEMLAADELAPEDPETLRATGFLVRNYKMLSREQWLEDTVKHTAQAFLGVTLGCAKCHDHMFDPISQREYYALRAIFEPHQVRTDRVPGELDRAKNGLVRAYDATNAPTWFLVRGDERHPLTNEVIAAGVPAALGGSLDLHEVRLPRLAAHPDERGFVVHDAVTASERAVAEAKAAWTRAQSGTNASVALLQGSFLAYDLADKKHAALLAVLAIEPADPTREPASAAEADPARLRQATNIALLQRSAAVADANLRHFQATAALASATNKVDELKKKLAEAELQVSKAINGLAKPLDANFEPRAVETYPSTSTGRRTAFANWVADRRNPLAARVAVNHVWLRHFGHGLVSTPADFGRNGRPPTNPQLLDWLAAEFMEPSVRCPGRNAGSSRTAVYNASPSNDVGAAWSFRHLHRLMVTSSAYRMASTPDEADLAADPDNRHLWRMNSRRLEAEAVRDNLLYVAGTLDAKIGGPEVDHTLALTSSRRSIYLRHAAEKQAEFLQIFDGAAVTECYERHPSVMPQQALALGNSELATKQARLLAGQLLSDAGGDDTRLVQLAFARVLSRRPTIDEQRQCLDFLSQRAVTSDSDGEAKRRAANLVLVLFNHHDFVTVR